MAEEILGVKIRRPLLKLRIPSLVDPPLLDVPPKRGPLGYVAIERVGPAHFTPITITPLEEARRKR